MSVQIKAGTRARALEDVVTVSDESSFTAAFLAHVTGCSTMISEPALSADGEAPPSRKECSSGPHGPATLVQKRREESRMPVHVVVPGHLHRLLARHRLDHRQRPGAGGAARLQQGAHDTLPRACFHVFDGGIKVGPQLAQMTARVPHHAVRRDRSP